MKEVRIINGQEAYLEDERTTRGKYEAMARTIGCLPEYYQLMNKYDNALRRCTNEQERWAIKTLAIQELNNLLNGSTSVGYGGNLTLDGKVIVEQKLDKEKK